MNGRLWCGRWSARGPISGADRMFPAREDLTICFAHAAYQMKATFDALNTGIRNFEVRERADLDRRIGEADVVLASGMWHNGLIQHAHKLRFIQSISSGTD